MKAVKKIVEVEINNSVTVKSLPFKPGSTVEVIVFPAERGQDIFAFMDNVTKKKKIAPMNLKQIEKIVHDARTGK
ncbi:MAG: hypothetical protein Q8J64_01550 [Thermodesulfovibrionales bacterium]|nr:hypothetical protein [Thermodesulfovibrionales bacterium]